VAKGCVRLSVLVVGLIVSSSAIAADQHSTDVTGLLHAARSLHILTNRVYGTATEGKHRGSTYLDFISEASLRYRIPVPLIAAVIKCESNWNATALSRKGAVGLMQVLPSTAEDVAKGSARFLLDPEVNITIGTAYLRILANRYDGETGKVVAGYNAGPTRVDSGRMLPRETRLYRKCVSRWTHIYSTRFQ
jgi:soluble lytic murein transglycosylase-like protein